MDREKLKKMGANPNHIPGIYNYCNRWCERCTFTSRCLTYAMEQEDPLKDDPEANDLENKKFWKRISDSFRLTMEMIQEDAEKLGINLDEIKNDKVLKKSIEDKDEFVHNHPLSDRAGKYMHAVENWLKESQGLFNLKTEEIQKRIILDLKNEDPVKDMEAIKDAVDIINWYFMQIKVKIMRALSGKFHDEYEEWENDFPKDSDGSAKVALIGIENSMAAWGTLLQQFPDDEKNILDKLVMLEQLRKVVETEFPDARKFKRPGFDD